MPNMSPFAEVSAPTKHNPGRKLRISARVKDALSLMVYEGKSRKEAANTAGITDHGLYQALSRPHVKAYRNKLLADLRDSAAARSVARVDRLADTAQSEHVKLEANKWLAGLEGVSPVQRSETHITGELTVSPGYVIDLTPQAPVIDGDVQDVTQGAEDGASVQQPGSSGNERRQDDEGGGGS